MKLYFWLKDHLWRICFWIIIVMGFIGAYNGDTWQERIIHAVLNTIGIWGVMMVGQLSFCEKVTEDDKKTLQEYNAKFVSFDKQGEK